MNKPVRLPAIARTLCSSARAFVAWTALLILSACSEGESTAPPPPTLPVVKPLVKQITEWDEYTGRLQAVQSVELRARVSGYVQSIHFRDGSQVKQGDLLFTIDPRSYQAVLDEANARLTSAKRDFRRGARSAYARPAWRGRGGAGR